MKDSSNDMSGQFDAVEAAKYGFGSFVVGSAPMAVVLHFFYSSAERLPSFDSIWETIFIAVSTSGVTFARRATTTISALDVFGIVYDGSMELVVASLFSVSVILLALVIVVAGQKVAPDRVPTLWVLGRIAGMVGGGYLAAAMATQVVLVDGFTFGPSQYLLLFGFGTIFAGMGVLRGTDTVESRVLNVDARGVASGFVAFLATLLIWDHQTSVFEEVAGTNGSGLDLLSNDVFLAAQIYFANHYSSAGYLSYPDSRAAPALYTLGVLMGATYVYRHYTTTPSSDWFSSHSVIIGYTFAAISVVLLTFAAPVSEPDLAGHLLLLPSQLIAVSVFGGTWGGLSVAIADFTYSMFAEGETEQIETRST